MRLPGRPPTHHLSGTRTLSLPLAVSARFTVQHLHPPHARRAPALGCRVSSSCSSEIANEEHGQSVAVDLEWSGVKSDQDKVRSKGGITSGPKA